MEYGNCGSCTERSSNCLRDLSKRNGKRAGAMYQKVMKGRSFELTR